jgi:hypothetical protein
MEQIEDLNSYSCTNLKRRMTIISIKEQHGNKQGIRKLQKKRRRRSTLDRSRQRRRFKICFYFLLSYFIFASMMFRILTMKFLYVIISS